ncbi:two-component system response regulator [Streptomyces sp. NPDC059680]|uniref:response regulator n=1 Tax=Streptomyces sp. NPDC059680 TaxID=3346904 RepID=UPI0036A6A374
MATDTMDRTMNAPAKILLIDDEPASMCAIQHALAPLQHDIITAACGEHALKTVLREDFALIILDMVIPGSMDGLQTMTYLKGLPRTQHVPIIMLTAAPRDVDCAYAAFKKGAADYMAKPIDPWELRAKARLLISLYSENRRLRRELERSQAQEAELRRALGKAANGLPGMT